ncbi:MAG: hypothetical protein IT581_01460 [Verrucomicrobiales bacterium]|nr:hypothetical protein [Verrucomicrobiales bacterium]
MPANEEATTKALAQAGPGIRTWNFFLRALRRLMLLGATTLMAANTFTASASENRVVQLDGAGSYMELPDGLGEDWKAATIEFRVRWDGFSYYATPLLFGGSQSSIGFNQDQAYPSPRVYSQKEGGRPKAIGMEEGVELGVWTHLAATFDQTQLRFWVNGRCMGTNELADPGLTVLRGSPSRWLGRSAWKENGYFRGRLDEVRLWNRVLSNDELARLPHTQVTGTEPGLWACWSMEVWKEESIGTACWSDGAHRLPAILRGGARVVPDDTSESATFEPAWWLAGTVRGPDDAPIVADLRWLDDDLGRWRVVADAGGRFRWRGTRRPSSMTLRATSGDLGALATVDLRQVGPVYLDLKLEAAASVSGKVVRWDGAARSGIGVRIRPLDAQANPRGDGWMTRSDRLGEFSFPALPDGDYAIECDARPDAFSPATELAVSPQRLRVRRSDGPTPVTLRVSAGGDGTVWQRFTRRDGLPDNALTALTVDSQGTLWIGTSAGLARYDGTKFIPWAGASGLAGGSVAALTVDVDDRLWVVGDRGLLRMSGRDFEPVPIATARPGLFVFDMTRTRDGAIWLATNQGIHRYRNGKWRAYGAEDGLPGTFVRAIWPDGRETIQASIEGLAVRVSERGTESCSPFRLPIWGSHPWFSKATESEANEDQRERSQWKHPGFLLERGDGMTVSPEVLDIPWAFEVRTLLPANDREMWVATHQHGLLRIATESIQSLTPAHGLPTAGVRVSLRARDGALWIGTAGGLVRWNGASTTLYRESDSLPGDHVADLLEAPDGAVWVAGNRGLARWVNGRFQPVPGGPFAAIHRLRMGLGGEIWAIAVGLESSFSEM